MNAPQHDHAFRFWPLAVNLLITLSIGVVAGFFTQPQVATWYVTLNKPTFNPPNWIFAPVWTTLYIMIGISAYLVWQRRGPSVAYINAQYIYFLQLFLNFSWSIIFFGMHQILAALAVIILLWCCIVANIFYFGKINKVAAWLLVPYLLWVSFASALNFGIYILNKE